MKLGKPETQKVRNPFVSKQRNKNLSEKEKELKERTKLEKQNCIGPGSNGDKNRNLSLYEYLNKIEPYLRNVIIDLQIYDVWKIQLTSFLQKMLKKSM